ncbi:TetR/AcrR family transcriptional regulator [Geminisphaera colitermitum]|uniref:TetR/AcrR family transcriptional regulator n=1 Tax=Geminisphaera colitermitum TaxID=1148786 RepID=UPI00019651F6|nr:TetR/AcrR family transcriptional regulator C-terminal domain-containing protein [Geminisphaera colitermitum]
MKTKTPKILSRRARPAKAPLSVDAILAASLDLMMREGLDGLSLRKVAAALDTGPASLYVYVDNLDSLLRLMLDRALGKVVIPSSTKGDWRERLSALLLSYLKVLMSLPGLGQLALTTVSAGPNTLRILEAILRLLREGNIDDDRAVWAVDTLLLQFTAIAAEQDARRRQASPIGLMKQAIEEIPAETYPNIHALGAKLMEGAPRERVRWTMDLMINGVLSTPRA